MAPVLTARSSPVMATADWDVPTETAPPTYDVKKMVLKEVVLAVLLAGEVVAAALDDDEATDEADSCETLATDEAERAAEDEDASAASDEDEASAEAMDEADCWAEEDWTGVLEATVGHAEKSV